ncbi:Enolase-phosphatase E1, partial [Stegodyphus mimosarum]
MSNDRKTTGLKKIQGFIWREEYEKGFLRGHVYDDTVQALKYWKSSQKKIYIYSSGSIEAQRLLFRHSTWGNLEHAPAHFILHEPCAIKTFEVTP